MTTRVRKVALVHILLFLVISLKNKITCKSILKKKTLLAIIFGVSPSKFILFILFIYNS